MPFLSRKSPEEEILEFAKKYNFDVYIIPEKSNAYYLVNDSYVATPKIENKITDLEEKLKKRTKESFLLMSLNPKNAENPHQLEECLHIKLIS